MGCVCFLFCFLFVLFLLPPFRAVYNGGLRYGCVCAAGLRAGKLTLTTCGSSQPYLFLLLRALARPQVYALTYMVMFLPSSSCSELSAPIGASRARTRMDAPTCGDCLRSGEQTLTIKGRQNICCSCVVLPSVPKRRTRAFLGIIYHCKLPLSALPDSACSATQRRGLVRHAAAAVPGLARIRTSHHQRYVDSVRCEVWKLRAV